MHQCYIIKYYIGCMVGRQSVFRPPQTIQASVTRLADFGSEIKKSAYILHALFYLTFNVGESCHPKSYCVRRPEMRKI